MGGIASVRQLSISRFRGIEALTWWPAPGMNIILGGGDVGKTTVLEALALLFSPSNATTVSESDYLKRDTSEGFEISAIVAFSESSGINTQPRFVWPWHWDGSDAVLPPAEGEATPPDDPVYRVRVKGTPELELAWEVIQPNGEADHFPVGVRRSIGVVRLSSDERNDRDLRLVYGSGLDRLIADLALRARIGQQISEVRLEPLLSTDGQEAMENLDERLASAALPHELTLGLTTSQGLSIGALIGLLAKKHGVSLPISSWGAGTRRMVALEIASAAEKEPSIMLVDEIERGLEPYRLRKLISKFADNDSQAFITTHSPVAISCSKHAQLWYMDDRGRMGKLMREKISAQQGRDPETFLARLAVIAEGPTEVGFLEYLLERAFGADPLDYGVRVCNGQGNPATLALLEALVASGLQFAGFADDEGTNPGRWRALKERLGDRLLQWQEGCTEQQVISAIASERLTDLLMDAGGTLDGDRLRTLAERLDIQDKQPDAIQEAAAEQGTNLRELIIAAASGSKEGAPQGQEKAWKKHAQHWFKSEPGGRELARHMAELGAWPSVRPQISPLINFILAAAGKPAINDFEP